MRLDRIKAYLIDLVFILLIFVICNNIIPRSDKLQRYKSEERELHESYIEQKFSKKEKMNTFMKKARIGYTKT